MLRTPWASVVGKTELGGRNEPNPVVGCTVPFIVRSIGVAFVGVPSIQCRPLAPGLARARPRRNSKALVDATIHRVIGTACF